MLTATLFRQLDTIGAQARSSLSLSELRLVGKNEHRLNIIWQPKTTRLDSVHTDDIQPNIRGPDRAHSCFPRASMSTRRLATKTATALPATPPLYPPAPADTRDGTVHARVAVLWVHARTRNRKGKKVSRRQVVEGGGVQVGAL